MRSLLPKLFEYRIYGLLVLAWIVLGAWVPGFLSASTSSLVLQNASILGLMAVGLTVAIIVGQLDLSIGSNLALAGIVAIELQRHVPIEAAIALGPLTGVLIGLVNGLVTTKAGINSFVVTLGTMIAVRGICHLVTDSQPVTAADASIGLKVDQQILWILTPRSIALIVAALVVQAWLTRTRAGRNVFAVGGNAEAARLVGINVDRCVVGAFVVSGLMAGIAGTLLALSLATASPVVGEQALITVFAAVIIGGTSLVGGRGNTIRTLAGVLLISGLTVGMDFKGVAFYFQSIVVGSILVLVVLIDSVYHGYRARLATRNPTRTPRPGSRNLVATAMKTSS